MSDIVRVKQHYPYDVFDANAPGGWRPREKPKREVAENFDPYHDEKGRFTTKDGAATPRGADGPHSKNWQERNKPVFIAQTEVESPQTIPDPEHTLIPPPPSLSNPEPQLVDPEQALVDAALTQVDHGPVTFTKLHNHYPRPQDFPTKIHPPYPYTSIWDLIGGKVALNGNDATSDGFGNACAIRLSYALNRSGLPIPYQKDVVSSGADKMWYFHTVNALNKYIREKFGPPTVVLTPTKDWQKELKGQYGIIEFEVRPHVWSDATGHFSLFDGTTNVDGPDHDYWQEARKINFWPIPLDETEVRRHSNHSPLAPRERP